MRYKHKKFFSVDYLFLYISGFLIIWMLFSFFADRKIPIIYSVVSESKRGYQVRDYYSGIMVGKKIPLGLDISTFASKLKDDLVSDGINIIPYPYFLKIKDGSETEIYFNINDDFNNTKVKNFLLRNPLKNIAFDDLPWYLNDEKKLIVLNNLKYYINEDGLSYNNDEYWIEVRDPSFVIPFMAKKGILIELN